MAEHSLQLEEFMQVMTACSNDAVFQGSWHFQRANHMLGLVDLPWR